jgi:hypothetical protein
MDHTPLEITSVFRDDDDMGKDQKHLLNHPDANYEDIGFNRNNPDPVDMDPQTRYPTTWMTGE